MVCTSIGLAVKGVPVIGVIYNPFLDQLVSDLYSPAFRDQYQTLLTHSTLLRKATGRG